MTLKKIKYIIFTSAVLLPHIVFAAPAENTFAGVLQYLARVLESVILPLLIGFTVVFFLWGLLKYVGSGADEKTREEGKNVMVYGVVSLFVIVSVWGLINFLVSSIFTDESVLDLTVIDVLKES